MYTTEDIIVTKIPIPCCTRKWYPGMNGKPSDYQDGKANALCFATKDGAFTTGIPDSNGYTSWYIASNGMRLDQSSYQYVFGCEAGLAGAVKALNKIISK